MYDYEALKALAKQLKRPITSLIALSSQNDPFYFGTDRDIRMGEWFAGLWKRFGYTRGVHIRRMHYAIVVQEDDILMPNGKLYENTEECWEYLTIAAKAARYLKLVDPEQFIDRRNESIERYAVYDGTEPSTSIELIGTYSEGDVSFPAFPDAPDYYLETYSSPQLYHLEIWCEKSTMNEILESVATRYHAFIQFGKGELSITTAVDALRRFERSGKPARIFYVSDFDPAGAGMPLSMSRKLEYFLRLYGNDHLDVKLFPVVLTRDQVLHYPRLIPKPIKKSEKRKDIFQKRYDVTGAVELDALEEIYPGELDRLLSAELGRYFDDGLDLKLWRAEGRQKAALDAIRNDIIAAHRGEIDAMKAEHDAIERVITGRMSAYTQKMRGLWQAIEQRLEAEQPEIDTDSIPVAEDAEERDGALYDSARDYLEQNAVYQEYKGKETYEEETAS